MNTNLTVAEARDQLWQLADPSDRNSPQFLYMLNEICSKLIQSGKWKGAVVNVTFDSSSGFITLPPEAYSVMAMTYNRCPAMTFTQFHAYQENGPGNLKDTLNWPGILMELGDGFVTQSDIPEGVISNLRVTLTNAADAGKTFRLFGQNGSNQPIYDLTTGVEGIDLVSAFPSADTPTTTSQLFAKVTGIQAPADLKGSWSLSYLVDGTATQIGQYLPWETIPIYSRYQTGVADKTIRILCQRRFRKMVNETDWVIPGNIGALREGFWHLKYLNSSDDEKAQMKFDRALYWLNNEARSFRAGASTPTNVQQWGYSGYYGWTGADY